MNWLNSTNAKEIMLFYNNILVIRIIQCTIIIVLLRLELSSPGVQFLQGDNHSSILWYVASLTNKQVKRFISTKTNKFVKSKNISWTTINLLTLIEPTIISKPLINKVINKFWEEKVEKLEDNKYIVVLFRLIYSTGNYATIGQLKKLNATVDDKEYYISYLNDFLSIMSNNYKSETIKQIAISYGIRDGSAPINRTKVDKTNDWLQYNEYKLPITINPLDYGELIHFDKAFKTYLIQISPLIIAKIKISRNNTLLKISIIKNGKVTLTYEDNVINNERFERTINSRKYIYILIDGKYTLDLFTIVKPTRFIKHKKEDKKLNEKIISFDVETFDRKEENGTINKIVHTISWFDGVSSYSYFITDYNNSSEMIQKALFDLCRAKYHSHKVYIHNFAKFDAIFLMKEMIKVGDVVPIIHKGRIVTISLSFQNKSGTKHYTIYFRDSYQILTASLRKLAINFNVQEKGIFPYNFVSEDNLNYNGSVPSHSYFSNVSLEEYSNYSSLFNNDWSLKFESIKYCKLDCISLYRIIESFNELIFNKFNIDMNKYPTLSSLSFAIFLTIFLRKVKYPIPMLSGKVAENIRTSYTGGSTDMYIPTNYNNELVYGYDVNSLYPSVMKEELFPIGKPTFFKGDIRKYQKDAFGFFHCEVVTPESLDHPIIQTHIKTKGGMRTVAALGTFETMLFSEEMDNAIKLGYKFKILWGYTFKKANIFYSFVNELYSLRLEYPKTHPMNYIAKLLLNSLYGRMGMNDEFTYCSFILKKSYPKFEEKFSDKIIDITEFDEHFLVEMIGDNIKTMFEDRTEIHNINIAIASAVTAYSRILMSKFKNNKLLKLFYTDTDSIYTNLDPTEMNFLFNDIVDNKELGKLKLETISNKAIFLSPKVYLLKSAADGTVIYKVKGLGKNINLNEEDFLNLLTKDNTLVKEQDKWFKNITQGIIEVKSQLYTLQQTDNKRELIYNSDNQLDGTKPYTLENNKIKYN